MGNKGKLIILCEAYRSIDYPLYKLEVEKVNIPVTILITTLKDLYELFRVLNERVFHNRLELIYYPPYSPRRVGAKGFKKWFWTLRDVMGERRHLWRFYDRYFGQLRDARIVFSSPGYTGVKIYVLNRLSKKNRLFFRDSGPPYMGRYSPRSVRDWAMLLFYKSIYGRSTQLGQYPSVGPWSSGFPLMADSFMEKCVKDVIDWSNGAELMADFNWSKFDVFDCGDYKVIYFHQNLVSSNYVGDRQKFAGELNRVFNVFRRYYRESEVACKFHPGHEPDRDVMGMGRELPVYIPAQFLYNKKVHIYLGISSSAIANVRGGQAVSIIDLISFLDEKVKKRFKERLIGASRSKIHFPATLEELEKVIGDIASNNGKAA